MKISHVALAVKDIEISKQFYQNLFGLAVIFEGEKPEKNRKFLFLEDDSGTRLELFQDDNPTPLTENLKDTKKIGIKHIAFAVDNIEAFLEKNETYSLNKLTPIKNGISVKRYIFITDPDNIPIEIFEQ
jgi:glyoxylase I family protein